MVLGIGVDIVSIKRMKKAIENPKFLEKVFSKEENLFFREKSFNSSSIAGNFAAKEAFSKALGTGIRHFNLNEISVLRNDLGAPYMIFSERIKCILAEKSIEDVLVSISHEDEYAIAFVEAITFIKS